MSERKVLNKYYNPEMWDSKIPKRKIPKNNQIKIRNMVAMTIQCTVCGEYIFSAKKLNSRKEVIEGDEYLGMKNCRFYFRCTRCASELTLKTDYEHDRYVCEHNCKSIHDRSEGIAKQEDKKQEDNVEDEMNALEKKAISSREYQEDIDQLEEIKEINSQREAISNQSLARKESKREESFKFTSKEEDELLEFVEYQSKLGRRKFQGDEDIEILSKIDDNISSEKSFISEISIQPKKKRKQKRSTKEKISLNIEY